MNRFFAKKGGIVLAGLLIACIIFLLEQLGNPLNMGLCVVSFLSDTAGALGLHSNETGQYIRTEIIGLFFGALVSANWARETHPRIGSAPLTRLLLGIFIAFGAMVFWGDSTRAFLRLAGGDANAIFGVAGLLLGVSLGAFFLFKGFSLGRGSGSTVSSGFGLVMPLLFGALLIVALCAPFFPMLVASSKKGVGSIHTTPLVGLGGGFLLGVLAQRSRFCFVAPLRDVLLVREYAFLYGLFVFVGVMFVFNYFFGQFTFGFASQPLAHSDSLWNFLSMSLVGLALAIAGTCPLRQFALAGEGDMDAGLLIIGMLIGVSLAQNWGFYSQYGTSPEGKLAVLVGLLFCVVLFFVKRQGRVTSEKGLLDVRGLSSPQALMQVRRSLANGFFPLTVLIRETTVLEGIKRMSEKKSLRVKCVFSSDFAMVEILER